MITVPGCVFLLMLLNFIEYSKNSVSNFKVVPAKYQIWKQSAKSVNSLNWCYVLKLAHFWLIWDAYLPITWASFLLVIPQGALRLPWCVLPLHCGVISLCFFFRTRYSLRVRKSCWPLRTLCPGCVRSSGPRVCRPYVRKTWRDPLRTMHNLQRCSQPTTVAFVNQQKT